MHSQWTSVASDLTPLVRARALDVERAGTLTAELVDAVRHAGLFRLTAAEEYGGGQAGIGTFFDVIEIMSEADASTGWSLMANIGSGTFVSAYLEPDAAAAILEPADTIIAGMLAPRGTAIPVEGGYRWSGRYAFGSGCGHASWFGAGAMVRVDGKVDTLDGMPHLRVTFVPRDRVELQGNWDVLGLVGTGSYDYEVLETFVDERFTFMGIDPLPRHEGATYQLGFLPLGAAGHGAVAVGIGRRALHEVARLAAGKRRAGRDVVGEQARFLHGFAEHEARWRGARSLMHAAYGDAEARAAAGGTVSSLDHARMRQSVTHVTTVVDEVVRFCYQWSGATGLRDDHPLGRCLRDMAAATQHMLVDGDSLVDAGRALVESWADGAPDADALTLSATSSNP